MVSRTLSFKDRDININAVVDPTSAQFQLWLAQMKHDHGDISSRELASVETRINSSAKKSKTLYNPFTGEIRKVEF
jgi:hypothetical protein